MNEHEHTPISLINDVLDDFCTRYGYTRGEAENTKIAPFIPTGTYVKYKGGVYQYIGQERYRKLNWIERIWRRLW